jgi:hypothetical protein
MRLVALCHECHEVTHMGLAEVHGNGAAAMQHFARVDGISAEEAKRRRDAAFELWLARSQELWTPDISILTESGVQIQQHGVVESAGGQFDVY